MTSLRPSREAGTYRPLPTQNLRVYERAAQMLNLRSPQQAKDLRAKLVRYVAGFRTAMRSDAGMLARFDLEIRGALDDTCTATGQFAVSLAKASLHDARENAALADYHANPCAETEDALETATLQEIGAKYILVAEIRARRLARQS